MSTIAGVDTAKSASKKKKKNNKKKSTTAPSGTNGTDSKDAPSVQPVAEEEDENEDDVAEEAVDTSSTNSAKIADQGAATKPIDGEAEDTDSEDGDDAVATTGNAQPAQSSETSALLDALQQERDKLRAEVSELRQSLEGLRSKHDNELSTVKEELEASQQGKEQAEAQFRDLRGKVNTIRSQLGDRLKQDAAELEQKREQIEELESRNTSAQEENGKLQADLAALKEKFETQSSEVESLRSRSSLSTTNFAKERDDLLSREAYLLEEYEVAKQAMQDWEILATEERSRREALGERVQELEEQLRSQTSAYERARTEVETQNSTVDGLQRALRDLQEERKKELRTLVEQSQEQLDTMNAKLEKAESQVTTIGAELETTKQALERAEPFEKEVKEKNLLIGKLRHEAVILNDHLTKALRFLKRGKPEDNVDRHLVTNHFLHFLQLDRSDPKKFQVLQLIAALLAWDDDQREKAGLVRQGSGGTLTAASGAGSTGSLRAPLSPFRRTPSSPAFQKDFPLDSSAAGSGSKESLAELWSEFLDREAEAGSVASGPGSTTSRQPSLALSMGRKKNAGIANIFSPTSEELPESRQSTPDAGDVQEKA